jgi:two-component system, NarL family, invasion response regulator UvrY
MKNFLLIDDHEIIRSGVKNVLLQLFTPCEVFESKDESTALEQLKLRTYDLIIMDVQMPNTDAAGLMDYINTKYPEAKVLIFSMTTENIYAKRFLKAGAMGFVSKNSGLVELKKAIEMILDNNVYVSNNLLEQLVSDLGNTNKTSNPLEKLSSREVQIVALLTSGKTITEISQILSLAISTVGTYKARLFEKLKVNNLVELIEMWKLYKENASSI